jgi:hypothetical protein
VEKWRQGDKETGRGARDFRFSIPTSFVGAGQVFGFRIYIPGGAGERGKYDFGF